MNSRRLAPEEWLVLAITAVAALLRFSTITGQSFWIDEATTVHEVGLSFGAMLSAIGSHESTPPLYFSVAWLWTRIFGHGELAIRSLSALAGTALVPVAYLSAKQLATRASGVVAALLVAVSPFMIWYSQEARAYMLFALFSGLSFMYFARAQAETRAPDAKNMIGWGVSSALAILTHFFAAFLIAPEALWLLYRRRDRASLLACAAVTVVQLAVLPLALVNHSRLLGWIKTLPLSVRINQIPIQLGVSQLYLSASALARDGILEALVLAAIVAALLAVANRTERRGALLAAALAACTIGVPIVLAWLGADYVVPRNFIAACVPLAALIGIACTTRRARFAGAVLAAGLTALFISAGTRIAANPAYQRPNWRAVAAALGSGIGPRAIVIYDGNAGEQPLAIYLPDAHFTYSGFPASNAPGKIGELDIVGRTFETLARQLPAGVHLVSSTSVDDFLVVRLSLTSTGPASPTALAARARSLLGPAPLGEPAVLLAG